MVFNGSTGASQALGTGSSPVRRSERSFTCLIGGKSRFVVPRKASD